MHHSEQKYAHFCSEWCIVGYGAGALWDLWDWSIGNHFANDIFKWWSLQEKMLCFILIPFSLKFEDLKLGCWDVGIGCGLPEAWWRICTSEKSFTIDSGNGLVPTGNDRYTNPNISQQDLIHNFHFHRRTHEILSVIAAEAQRVKGL